MVLHLLQSSCQRVNADLKDSKRVLKRDRMLLVAAYDNATFDEYTNSFDLSQWIAFLPLAILSQVCWEISECHIYDNSSFGACIQSMCADILAIACA